MISKKVYVLQLKRKDDFKANLERVSTLVWRCMKRSIICTSDLVLSGYAFDVLDEIASFSDYALKHYLEITKEKTLITSLIEKENNKFYNVTKVIKDQKVIYSQKKTRLFPLNGEQEYISPGEIDAIDFFEIDGIKCCVLNCFELRFVELWNKVKGAEIIFVLAQWDKERKHHFETLIQALAIANQSFVVASDCANEGMSKASSIVTPFGEVCKDGKKGVVYMDLKIEEVKKMRSFIKIGLEDS